MTGNNGKTPEAPKRLSVGETDDGLVQIEIQLRKYHLWVMEANGFTRFKVSSLVTEIMKGFGDKPAEAYEERIRQNMLLEVYAPLAVVSHGEVPTEEQFFGMPEVDLAFWVNAAKELGHKFEWLDGLNEVYEQGAEAKNRLVHDVKKKSRRKPNLPITPKTSTVPKT